MDEPLDLSGMAASSGHLLILYAIFELRIYTKIINIKYN
jgi:hypothetical protein